MKDNMKKTINELNEAKMCAWLDKTTTDKCQLITCRELIARYGVGKRLFVEKYSKKKINGQYKPLSKPRVSYYFTMRDGAEEWLFSCPKYVYEPSMYADLTDEPTKLTHEAL